MLTQRDDSLLARHRPSRESDYQIEWLYEDHDRNRGIPAFLGPARCRGAR
jgi:hypothetical protein